MKANPKALKALLILAASACLLALPHAPARASRQAEARAVSIRVEDGKEVRLYAGSYALVIGVSNYTAGWPKLPGVKRDVEEVARALERQGFLVTVVENPDSAQLDKAFKTFIDEHGTNVENRLLFYFAGHGHTVKQSYGEEMGYVVPTDAPDPNRDPAGFMSKAMDMQQMELYARRIQSKHALFLFDSCFSGAIFALSRAIPDAITYKTARPVRQFITSGSADEFVPDQSIFRRQFVEAIEGEADLNRDGYVTGTELGMFLQDKVVNYSKNTQHPQYGKIRNPNLDKGDFVFALPAPPRKEMLVIGNTVIDPDKPPAPSASPSPAGSLAVELAFWDSIKNSADPEDFKEYLKKYPTGQFAGIAQRRLSSLTANAAAVQPKPGTVVRTRSGIELVYIPPGSFMMGSENGGGDEKPVHRVTIRDGFYMGKYEVTQAQWQAVMGNNPSYFRGDNLPVEQITSEDAQKFIGRLNAASDGFIYRMPSEAEWEYAARAGATTDYFWGDDKTQACQYANVADLVGKAKHSDFLPVTCSDGYAETSPVGSFRPNAFGLYDMTGNVFERCEDVYHSSYSGAPSDGSAWLTAEGGTSRVLRGGAWFNAPIVLSFRSITSPELKSNVTGLRVAARSAP